MLMHLGGASPHAGRTASAWRPHPAASPDTSSRRTAATSPPCLVGCVRPAQHEGRFDCTARLPGASTLLNRQAPWSAGLQNCTSGPATAEAPPHICLAEWHGRRLHGIEQAAKCCTQYLGAGDGGAVARVAVARQVEGGQAAHVAQALDGHRIVPHKCRDRVCKPVPQ